jgi:hypothetical protein
MDLLRIQKLKGEGDREGMTERKRGRGVSAETENVLWGTFTAESNDPIVQPLRIPHLS